MVVAEQKKRRKKYTKYTEEIEAKDENWQKNADFLPFLALFQGKELCFVLCGKNFWYDPFLSVLTHVWRSRIRAYQKLFTT